MSFHLVSSKHADVRRSPTGPGSGSESDAASDEEQLPKLQSFLKGWLKGAALQYALEEHYDTFFARNSDNAKEGTAYALEAANDMLKVFGIWGPWDTTSIRLDEMTDYHPSEEEEEVEEVREERQDCEGDEDDRVCFSENWRPNGGSSLDYSQSQRDALDASVGARARSRSTSRSFDEPTSRRVFRRETRVS